MKFVIHSSSVSPHQAPLLLSASKLLPPCSIEMLYTSTPSDPFRATGVYQTVAHLVRHWENSERDWQELLGANLVMENHRNFDWLEKLAKNGKTVLYPSERWFKPECVPHTMFYIPGILKMALPFAWSRVRKIYKLIKNYPNFYYLPMGIHAARDMARICGLLHGDLMCLFKAPELEYENRPDGRIRARNGKDAHYCLDKMRMWGYFVAPSALCTRNQAPGTNAPKRVLWVGRFLRWKRVDDIIQAVKDVPNLTLDLYGAGPDEARLRKVAAGCDNVDFKGLVPLSEVRRLMRCHDIYVLSSNAFEGWGAVINEALEEQMKVIATYEGGASGTLLPATNLYPSGDFKALRALLTQPIADVPIGDWSVNQAAKNLINWR